jgi:hypothetical protein
MMDEQGMAALLTEIDRLVSDRGSSDAEIVARLRRLMAQAKGGAA